MKRFRVHDLSGDENIICDVSSWTEGRSDCEKSAIQEAEKSRETVTMGKIIVEVIHGKG